MFLFSLLQLFFFLPIVQGESGIFLEFNRSHFQCSVNQNHSGHSVFYLTILYILTRCVVENEFSSCKSFKSNIHLKIFIHGSNIEYLNTLLLFNVIRKYFCFQVNHFSPVPRSRVRCFCRLFSVQIFTWLYFSWGS